MAPHCKSFADFGGNASGKAYSAHLQKLDGCENLESFEEKSGETFCDLHYD